MDWPRFWPQPAAGSAWINSPPVLDWLEAALSSGRFGASGEKLLAANALSQVIGACASAVTAWWTVLPSALVVIVN